MPRNQLLRPVENLLVGHFKGFGGCVYNNNPPSCTKAQGNALPVELLM